MTERRVRVPRYETKPAPKPAAPLPAEERPILIAAGTLAVVGWGGLVMLINLALPTLGPRWMFFALWLVALTGTAVPFVRYLNRRFSNPAGQPASPAVILRQSIWVGLFGATCAWLQLGRALNLPLALLLAGALGMVEWFIRVREKSRWTPDD